MKSFLAIILVTSFLVAIALISEGPDQSVRAERLTVKATERVDPNPITPESSPDGSLELSIEEDASQTEVAVSLAHPPDQEELVEIGTALDPAVFNHPPSAIQTSNAVQNIGPYIDPDADFFPTAETSEPVEIGNYIDPDLGPQESQIQGGLIEIGEFIDPDRTDDSDTVDKPVDIGPPLDPDRHLN